MDDERLRLAVYDHLAATGAEPGRDELALRLGVTTDEVGDGLGRLAATRHVVLDPHGRIVMAHPFATIPLGFSVMGERTLWWGGCAWDSFAIPHVVDDAADVLVATTCPACGRALAWNVDRDGPPAGDEVAHFLVPVTHIWDDVVHTCAHQRIFCTREHVEDWLRSTGNAEGCVMDLATLWRLASHWYDGRMRAGYERREPTEAREYFASVGLTGPFWEV